MTKRFCDVCGKPAAESIALEMDVPALERNILNKEPAIVCLKVTISNFSFRNHPTGNVGPPDLCADCVNDLIYKLAVSR